MSETGHSLCFWLVFLIVVSPNVSALQLSGRKDLDAILLEF